MTRNHICDRNGPPAKVIDESGDEPITTCAMTLAQACRPFYVLFDRIRAGSIPRQVDAARMTVHDPCIALMNDGCAG